MDILILENSFNIKMLKLLKKKRKLPPKTAKMISNDIDTIVNNTIEKGQCIVNNHYDVNFQQFKNEFEYECFCNEIYFDCNKCGNKIGEMVRYSLVKICTMLNEKFYNKIICVDVSVCTSRFKSITIKFYLYREGQSYLTNDLNCYSQPVGHIVFKTRT